MPFKYKSLTPDEKYLTNATNPPKVKIEFFPNFKKINNVNCYSNEGNKWRNSKINIIDNNNLEIVLDGKFVGERGRINCSLQEKNGFWRWLGIQFVLAD